MGTIPSNNQNENGVTEVSSDCNSGEHLGSNIAEREVGEWASGNALQ